MRVISLPSRKKGREVWTSEVHDSSRELVASVDPLARLTNCIDNDRSAFAYPECYRRTVDFPEPVAPITLKSSQLPEVTVGCTRNARDDNSAL